MKAGRQYTYQELERTFHYSEFREALREQIDALAPKFYRQWLDEIADLRENPPDHEIGRLYAEWPMTVVMDVNARQFERLEAKVRAMTAAQAA